MASVIMKSTVCDKIVVSRTIDGKTCSMNLFNIDFMIAFFTHGVRSVWKRWSRVLLSESRKTSKVVNVVLLVGIGG